MIIFIILIREKKSVRVLVDTLLVTLLMCLLKTQIAITLSSTKDNYVEIFVCSQKVECVHMLLEEVSEVQKPAIFLRR